MHDSAVASVRPRSRSRSRTSSAVPTSSREKRYGSASATSASLESPARAARRPGCDEEIDVELEVARADRHVDPVAVAARGGERLRDRRLRDAVEPEHAACGRLRPLEQPAQRLGLEHARPELLQLARRPRAARRRRSRPRRARPPAPCRRGRPRARRPAASPACVTPSAKSVYGRLRRVGDPARELLDRRPELLLDVQPDAGRRARAARSCGRRASGRGRPRCTSRSYESPSRERCLEIGRIVADDRDPRRIDAEAKQRRGEVRAVAVVAVAAHELRARRDDRGADARATAVPTRRRDDA